MNKKGNFNTDNSYWLEFITENNFLNYSVLKADTTQIVCKVYINKNYEYVESSLLSKNPGVIQKLFCINAYFFVMILLLLDTHNPCLRLGAGNSVD